MQFFINHIVNRNLLKSGFTSTVSRYSIIRDWQKWINLERFAEGRIKGRKIQEQSDWRII